METAISTVHGSFRINKETREATSRHILHLVGEEALEIYNTFSLSTAEQKLYVLFRKFEDYCNPRRNITFERHKFFTCVQEPTEGIDQYVTKASTCEFGVLCESLIRDRIVCGILCDTMREKLLQENDLSLQKAIDMCRASEFSKRQTKSITEESKSVDYVDKKATQSGKFPPKDRKDNQRSLRDSTISHGVCVGEMLVLKAICDALTH